MIHVIATATVAAGRRSDFLAEFRRVVPLVRAEAGCIEYGPAIDLDTGFKGLPSARADVVTIVEKWDDVAALAAHLGAPHMVQFREAVKGLVAAIEIRVMEPVD